MGNIPYGKQLINAQDIEVVGKVLKTDWISQGPKIREFENALCGYTGVKYAVVVSSGTAALHLACLAAGIKQGDEVITTPMSFVASANCILYCGAKPIFADIQSGIANIDPQKIAKELNNRTKGIIPVHFAGTSCDMEAIRQISKRKHLLVIEDAAHALGATYKGVKVGSCKYSDMTVFSFHPTKSITTGEGGAILTNQKDLYERLLLLRNHGIAKDFKRSNVNVRPWYYEMKILGFNYRITDFQAALGVSQLDKISKFIARRVEIAKLYDKAFQNTEWLKVLQIGERDGSSCHIYVVLIDFRKIQKTRGEVMNYLKRHGIGTQVHYIPIYRHPFYRKLFAYRICDYPESEKYYVSALTLPLHPGVKKADLDLVIKKILSLSKERI